MKRTLSLQKKMTLFIVSILVTMAAIILVVFLPTTTSILKLTDNVAQTEEYLEDQYQQAQNMQKSVREIDDIIEDIQKFSSSTVKFGKELTLITQLEDIALQHNIDQKFNIRFIDKGEAKGNNYLPPSYYQFSFLNQGSYKDQLDYLRTLETLPYYVIINSIKWDKRGTTEVVDTTPTTLTFEAIIYATP